MRNQRFSKLSYTNREIDKSNKLLLVFCSLSLEGTKEGEVIQLDYQHVYVWDLEKLFVLHVLLFCIFLAADWGYICIIETTLALKCSKQCICDEI